MYLVQTRYRAACDGDDGLTLMESPATDPRVAVLARSKPIEAAGFRACSPPRFDTGPAKAIPARKMPAEEAEALHTMPNDSTAQKMTRMPALCPSLGPVHWRIRMAGSKLLHAVIGD
jgi:hypothetical protein